ncbi:MAG: MerR family transcriptional regulator [Acidimicrobiales bacterium]
MSGRAYLSIGDVLSLLREEFPDVTISKIRFLESQGLVDPERSPSGYRKFFEQDVARLRWVLRKQRDQFLPLRVIRDRLAAAGNGVPPDDDPADAVSGTGTEWSSAADAVTVGAHAGAGVATQSYGSATAADAVRSAGSLPRSGANGAVGAGDAPPPSRPEPASALARTGEPAAHDRRGDDAGDAAAVPSDSAADGARAASGRGGVEAATRVSAASPPAQPSSPDGRHVAEHPPAVVPSVVPATTVARTGASGSRSLGKAASGPLDASLTGVSLTLAELCAASGLSTQAIGSLESAGMIVPMSIAGGKFYDEEALTVAKLAAAFERFGIEPRHLRLFRNAADREVGLVEQVVAPLLRQRNPEARQRAVDAASELAGLGQSLRAALVHGELHRLLGN